MAADNLDRLAKAPFVACTLCGVSFKGSEVAEHDASDGHQSRKGSYLVDKAIMKVTGYGGCPGPCFSAKGLPLIDA